MKRVHHLIRLLPRLAIRRLQQAEVLRGEQPWRAPAFLGRLRWPASTEVARQAASSVTSESASFVRGRHALGREQSIEFGIAQQAALQDAVCRTDLPVLTASFTISAVAAYPMRGLSAVATAVLRSSSSRARSASAVMPSTHLVPKRVHRRPQNPRRRAAHSRR